MNREQFERLNSLSEKANNLTANPAELREYTYLLNEWNSTSGHNLIDSFFIHPRRINVDKK